MTSRTATPSNLSAQWTASQPGDTLVLSGTFTDWRPMSRNFSTPLIVDCTNAVLQGFYGGNLTGVIFLGGKWMPSPDRPHAFHIDNGHAITVVNPVCHSDTNATGNALYVYGGGDIKIENPITTGFLNGVVLSKINGFSVIGGDYSGMGSDGVDIWNSQNGSVEDVYVHDGKLYGSSHPDGVQLASNAGAPQTVNVKVLRARVVGHFQGVTAFNHASQGQLGFQNIVMEDNDVSCAYINGMALYDCVGGSMQRNNVSTIPNSQYQSRIYFERNTGVTKAGNVVAAYGSHPAITD